MVESSNQLNVFAGVAKKTGFPDFLVQLSRRPLPLPRAMEISPFLQEVFTETEHGANEGAPYTPQFILSIRNEASYHRARAEQENSDAGTKAGLLASS
jgi:hypothetical protein